MSVYVITGAGTDIGKTYVTTLLVRQLRAAGRKVLALKPVASGVPAIDTPAFAETDTAALLAAAGLAITPASVEACSPWRYTTPLSPDMAAAAEGRSLPLQAVLDWCRGQIAAAAGESVVLIEGVGGVMSPMTSDALNLDLIKALGCPVVLVAGSYLGALSHAFTAIETLKAHGVPVRSVILNESAGSSVSFIATLESLQRHLPDYSISTAARHADRVDLDLA